MYIRRSLVFGLLLILSAAIIGCAPRATGGQAAELAGDERAVVDIPAIVIDYDADGNPGIGGMPLAAIAPALGMQPEMIDQLVLPADQIAAFTASNIQHIQVDNATDGVLIMINGEPIPSLVWNDETLANLAGLLATTGLSDFPLDSLLPMIRTMGVAVIAKFPVADGNAPIEAVRLGEGTAAAAATAAQEAYLDSVSNNVSELHLGVDYNEDGSWVVGGMSTEEWAGTIEGVPWESLNLPADMLADLQAVGVESAFVGTNVDGISIKIGGMDLPYISWKHGELTHLVRIANQMGMLDGALGENPEAMLGFIEQWLPAVQASDVKINVDFP